MANPKHKLEREEMMAFLLGELEDAEQSRIESLFLSDAGLEKELESAKTELFNEYRSGRLSEARSGRFKQRFLPESLEEEKKEFQEMLEKNEEARSKGESLPAPVATSSSSASSSAAESSAKKGGAARSAPAPRAKNRTLVLLVVAILAVGGAAAAVALGGGSETKAPAATGEVMLSSFSVRGKSQVVALPGAEQIRLILPISVGARPFGAYEASLLFGEERQALASEVSDNTARALIQRSDLREGRYDIELRGIEDDGDSEVIGYYSFRK